MVDAAFLRHVGGTARGGKARLPGLGEEGKGLRKNSWTQRGRKTLLVCEIAKPAHASRLPPCMTILQSAFGLCMSCITPITHQSNAVFDLNYKWVQYSCCDAAEELVWENFDDRAVEQEAAFKTHHQAASRAWWVVNLSIHPLSQTL